MKVTTESGTVYEFEQREGTWFVLRENPQAEGELRRDGDWVRLQVEPHPAVGYAMPLMLEPLGEGDVTIRMTTKVKKVQR